MIRSLIEDMLFENSRIVSRPIFPLHLCTKKKPLIVKAIAGMNVNQGDLHESTEVVVFHNRSDPLEI